MDSYEHSTQPVTAASLYNIILQSDNILTFFGTRYNLCAKADLENCLVIFAMLWKNYIGMHQFDDPVWDHMEKVARRIVSQIEMSIWYPLSKVMFRILHESSASNFPYLWTLVHVKFHLYETSNKVGNYYGIARIVMTRQL